MTIVTFDIASFTNYTKTTIKQKGGVMLFMYIHTHSVEKCKADVPEQLNKIKSELRDSARQTGVNFLGVYAAAHEHTIYAIIEADDLEALEQVLKPLTVWGDASLIPVVSARDNQS